MASGTITKYASGEVVEPTALTPGSSVELAADGALQYQKHGNIVEVYGYHIQPKNNISNKSSVVIATLSASCKPAMARAIFSAGSVDGGMGGQIVVGGSSGNITFFNCSGASWSAGTNFNFYCIFCTD